MHFDLKARFELPEAVMTDNTIIFHEPVRPGDRLRTHQVLRSVSEEKTTKLGTGRFWVIDVEYHNQHDELVGVESYTGFGYRRAAVTTATPGSLWGDVAAGDALPELRYDVTATTVVLGALASRDWRPMHHDYDFAVEPQRHPGHLPEHAEPGGLVRALPHRLDRSPRPAGPGDVPHEGLGVPGRHHGARRHGRAGPRSTTPAAGGRRWPSSWRWTATSRRPARARIALPQTTDDNPWARRGDQWRP